MIPRLNHKPARRLCAAALLALPLAAVLPARAAPDDHRIHIIYWDKWIGFEVKGILEVVDAFNRAQDRIFVDYLPTSQIDRKMIVATAGGDPPDVAGIWAYNVPGYADAEALTPLDGFIRRDGGTVEQWLARYYPIYAEMIQHGGHVYAGITTPATMALFWNKTLFREAGLDPERPPRTLAEFNDYCRRLTRRDPATGAITQMGFLPQEPGWWPWVFCRWFGGRFFDGRRVTIATDPKNLEAMRWIEAFSKDNGGAAVKIFASGFGAWGSPTAPFFTGKLAMVVQGVWYPNYIRQYKPGLDYGVGPWPEAVPGVKDFSMAEADILVIPRGARHPEAAWEFIKYVNSCNLQARTYDEMTGMERVCFYQGKLSPLRAWSPFFAQHHPNPAIGVFRALAASPHCVATPDIGIYAEFYREFIAAFERVRLLEATPEAALEFAQKRLDQSWDRYVLSLRRHGQALPVAITNSR